MLIVLLFISFSLLADGTPPTGAGTSGDPYQIATLDNLLWVSTNDTSWSSDFVQTAVIDASDTSTWPGGEGFSPIGNSTTRFTGNYDGQGYEIDGLFINRPSYDYQGFFGYTDNAGISNLGVSNVDITGNGRVGGLAGVADSTAVINCYSSGTVTGNGEYVGGLSGLNTNYSNLSYCYSIGNVSGLNFTGGLVGVNQENSSMSDCYSSSDVTGTNLYAAGLTAVNQGFSSIIDCYSYGFVNAVSGAGGLISYIIDGTTTNSFWDTQASGQSTSGGGTGKTTAEMKDRNTYINAGWDFMNETGNGSDDLWGINYLDNNGYPFLYHQGYSDETPVGSGTSGDPYQISHIAHLRVISENTVYWNKHFIQTADIDASDTQNWNNGAGFSPIGNNPNYFNGIYNGNGYIISNLFIDRPSTDYIGLFGFTDHADISNLGIVNVDITGDDYIGSLVGNTQHLSSVTNCYSTGSVSGDSRVGGLVGYNYNTTIMNCYSAANVIGTTSYIGGLIGYNVYYTTVTNCYSTGSVSGNSSIGGLIGANAGDPVNYCFWDMETSGRSNSAGGIGKTTIQMKTESTYVNAGWDFYGETTNGAADHWVMINELNNGYPLLTWQVELIFIAGFDISNSEIYIGTEIQFNDNSYGDNITSWQWDFENDGTYDSTEQNPVYIYSSPGLYSVKLTVSNESSTDSSTRSDYIYVNTTPASPQNVQINLTGDDADISWDAVTVDNDNVPINLDGYVVKYSEDNIDFYYLQFTNQLNHTHTYVVIHSPQMYYQVSSYKAYSTRQLTYLQELNNRREKIRWPEVKQNLERFGK